MIDLIKNLNFRNVNSGKGIPDDIIRGIIGQQQKAFRGRLSGEKIDDALLKNI